MKRNLLFTTIFLVLFAENTFSQEYHPFLNNSSWILSDWVSCCRPSETKNIDEGIDEEIEGNVYKKFIDPFSFNNPIVYLREDIEERKVYKLVNEEDVLLYDFNLENSDTISQYGYTFVATVDYIILNEQARKRIILHSVELYYNHVLTQTWIEGVGTDTHPFYPDFNMYNVASTSGGYKVYTKCSFQNGEHFYGDINCLSLLNTNTLETVNQNITFYPNPFTTTLSISSDENMNNASIKVYNSVGQLVREKTNLKGQKITIERENLQSGLYLIQLFENNKLLKTSKVLIED